MYPYLIKLVRRVLVTAALFAPLLWTEAWCQQQPAPTAFYLQYHRSAQPFDTRPSPDALQSMRLDGIRHATVYPHRHQRDDFDFNYLWLQQYQEGYDHRSGGAALGKILRMSIESLYRDYHGNSTRVDHGDDDFASRYQEFDYKLRLSDDRIKFGIEYEF